MRTYKFCMAAAFATMSLGISGQDKPADHLLISEFVINSEAESATAGSAEYVEIFNPTENAISLDNYLVTDLMQYYNLPQIVNENITEPFSGADGIYRFPPGYTIPSGGVVVVTWRAQSFLNDHFGGDLNAFTAQPGNPQLFETATNTVEPVADNGPLTHPGVPDMISYDPTTNLVDKVNFSRTNGNEFIGLIYWDGVSDLVKDVDFVSWGTPSGGNYIVDKGGWSVDGPDADTAASTYEADNGVADYRIDLTLRVEPNALVRRTIIEVGEGTSALGNGITGDDESMEWCWDTFGIAEEVANAAGRVHLSPGIAHLPKASDNPPPFIGGVTRDVMDPQPGNTFKIICNAGGVTPPTVQLFIDDNGAGFKPPINMTYESFSNTYEATVGPYPEGTYVKYYIEATQGGKTARHPVEVPPIFAVHYDLHGVYISAGGPTTDDVVINEIMFDPMGGDNSTRAEWTELHNKRSTPFDVSGYMWTENVTQFTVKETRIPSGAIIPPNGYLILTHNLPLYTTQYAGQPPYDEDLVFEVREMIVGNTMTYNNVNFTNPAAGDSPGITSPNGYRWKNRPSVGTPFNNVTYSTTSPWPQEGQFVVNSGHTFELKAPSLDNTNGANWAVSLVPHGTPLGPNQTSAVGDWTMY